MAHWPAWALWGFVASGGDGDPAGGRAALGISRMSLPFLFGAVVSGRPAPGDHPGLCAYLLGGWVFAFLYALLLGSFAAPGLWAAGIGLLVGAGCTGRS